MEPGLGLQRALSSHYHLSGRVVRAQDLQFGGPEFKFCSDRLLDLFAVVSGILVNNDPVTFDLNYLAHAFVRPQ